MTSSGSPVDRRGAVVAGIGFTSSATAADIVLHIMATLTAAGIEPERLVSLATHPRKRDSAALALAAAELGLSVHFADSDDTTSVCEAAARAYGQLLVGKHKSARVTCALALLDQTPSAAMASSTVATSWAGP